jgi:hypothetical protein
MKAHTLCSEIPTTGAFEAAVQHVFWPDLGRNPARLRGLAHHGPDRLWSCSVCRPFTMTRALSSPPPTSAFTSQERRLIRRCSTPTRVQAWLNRLPYNREPGGPTQRSFRVVVRTHRAHCLEAALAAAVILEQHGYPPRVLSLDSMDGLGHVLFLYQHRGRWGSVARSRDPGLHGRKPVFRTARDLALSYVDPYVDFTGGVTAYAVVDLPELMGSYDWRFSARNLWKVENALIDYRHQRLETSKARIARWRRKYRAFREQFPDRKPLFYPGRERWTPLPPEFLR